MNEDGCNRWANSETCDVVIWLDDMKRSYLRKLCKRAWCQAPHDRLVEQLKWDREAVAVYRLASEIRQFIEEQSPLQATPLYADLLKGALRRVHWEQVAEHYLDRFRHGYMEEQKKKSRHVPIKK